jgi:O-antigen/teichoic acid export membrane protein
MSARQIGLPAFGTVEIAVPAATSHSLSLRSNFGWALAGNVIYAISQWGMIVALAKLGSAFVLGQFSLGIALVTPVLMFSNFDLRAVQATDAHRQYRFGEYLRLRVWLTLAALGIIAAVVWFCGYDGRTAAVILAVALAKAVETLSDIHYGLFQLNDRLDQTGQSMMLRGVLSVCALSAGLYFTHDVFWGCIWVAIAWVAVLLLFDFRRGRRIVANTEHAAETAPGGWLRERRLLGLALPLGVVTTLAAVNLHMPRYFVDARLGERQLGMFSALAYATIALTLIGDSMGSCVVPRLSRLYAVGKLAEYRTLLLRLLVMGSAFGLFGLLMARGFGSWFLRFFYNANYAAQSEVFVLLMTAAAIHFAASMLTCGITSARCFRIQVLLYALVAASTALGCAYFVPTMGLKGAAVAVICGAVVRLVLSAAVIAWLLSADARLKRLRLFCQ